MKIKNEAEKDAQGLHPHLGFNEVVYSVNISLQHKYIYVESPKCGCSAIKYTLQRLECGDNKIVRDVTNLHQREFSPLLNIKQIGSFSRLIADPRFFKFCFVRNPYERLLSAYFDKIKGNRPPKGRILQQLGLPSHRLNTPVSLSEFVHAVAEQPVAFMDPHWRVQYYQTMQAGIAYDFIGRFENFQDDIRTIGARLSPNFGQYLIIERLNAPRLPGNDGDILTPELKDIVNNTYRKDFEFFGYEPQ